MKKWEIVKSKNDFNNIIKNGRYQKNKSFVIYNKEKIERFPHFGIAISKKTGIAVLRNHLKRQIRVILDETKDLFPNNRDYIIMIKKSCVDLSFHEMKSELINLIKEIK